MNNWLIVMLGITAVGVIYWVLIGQGKYNKMIQGEK